MSYVCLIHFLTLGPKSVPDMKVQLNKTFVFSLDPKYVVIVIVILGKLNIVICI